MQHVFDTVKNLIQLSRYGENFGGPHVIYTGIGTAAGLRDANGFLAPMHYHQYPPFLQDMMNAIPNLRTYLILIDPYQENPPYVVAEKRLVPLDLGDLEAFSSQDRRLTVIVTRKNICTCLDSPEYQEQLQAENITAELRSLNEFAMQSNVTTFYHDFTGRRNNLLAEVFDSELGAHLDHIVYGLSMREDHGCYFDLTQPGSYMPYRIQTVMGNDNALHQILRVFNYYKYIVTDTIGAIAHEKALYDPSMHDRISLQQQQIVNTLKIFFTNELLTVFRTVFRLANGVDEPLAVVNPYFFNFMVNPQERLYFCELLHARQYVQTFEELKIYCSRYLHIISQVKQLDLDGYEMLNFILHSPEPYSWYANISNFF